MSDVFFQQLSLSAPHVNLEVGSGSHVQQTAQVMSRFEPVVLERKSDLVLVYGDVNSTVTVTLVYAKLGMRVGYMEAGLRLFDCTMLEEINRLVTDQIADLLSTPSEDGNINLVCERIPAERVYLVGTVMIVTLVRLLPTALERWKDERFRVPGLEVERERYVLATFHRPSNVDDPTMLAEIMVALTDISRQIPLVFPTHPRTRQRRADLNLQPSTFHFHLFDPAGYLDFPAFQCHAVLVITDLDGIQEETSYLGVPCLIVRENTEQPVIVTFGTNQPVGRDMARLRQAAARIQGSNVKPHRIPLLWDGKAGERIAERIASRC